MPGSRTQRHCSACDRDVLNLSAMRESEAMAVIAQLQIRRICVRYVSGADGHIIHEPETRSPSLRPTACRAPLAAGALAMTLNGASCAPALTDAKPASSCPQPARHVPTGASETPESRGKGASTPIAPPVCGPEQIETPTGCEENPRKATMGVPVFPTRRELSERLFFDRGKYDIRPSAQPIIDEVARALKALPEIRKLVIKGYISRDETAAKKLDAARAKRVREQLIAAGIDPGRLVVAARGYAPRSEPSMESADPQWARHVDFEILEQDGVR